MRLNFKLLFLTSSFLFFSAPLYPGGTTAAPLLRFIPSPRVSSMGGAGVGISGDYSSAALNPAVLGSLENNWVGALYHNALMDSGLGYLFLSIKTGSGSLALEALAYSGGEIKIDDTAGRHADLHGKKLSAQKDMIFSAAYGSRILSENMKWGVRARYYTSELLEEYSARTISADAGLLIRTSFFKKGHRMIYEGLYSEGLEAGISVLNLGEGISYTGEEKKDPLPIKLKGGIAYPLRLSREHSLIAASDLSYDVYGRQVRGGAGMEYIHRELFFLRAGYFINYEIKNFTWGLGVIYGKFQFDYGMELSPAINSRHLLMLRARF